MKNTFMSCWIFCKYHLSAFIAFLIGLALYLLMFSLSEIMGFPNRIPFTPNSIAELQFVGNWLLPALWSAVLTSLSSLAIFNIGKKLNGYTTGWRALRIFWFLACARLTINLLSIPYLIMVKINTPEKWHLFQERWYWWLLMLLFSESGQEAFREVFEILGVRAGTQIIAEEDAKVKPIQELEQ